MTSSIDERVVNMSFNNAQFEKNMRTTMSSLDKLKAVLNFNGAGKGLEGISLGVDRIASRFNALGAIGFTALQSLTNSAIGFAKKISGSILDPIVEGGKRRALNIEQAKFMLEGLHISWNKIKDDILYGVKDTAYGLDEAAKAASSLAASQVKVGSEMRTALRGISGVAAMTGSAYSDIADVFTKVAGQGRLMGDDLLRLSSRGLNAAAILAKSMGTTEAAVRKMVTDGKIDFKMFAEAMDSAFGKHAKDANKTFEGSLSNMKAALARIGAEGAAPYFENLRDTFNALTPKIDAIHEALMPLINLLTGGMKRSTEKVVEFIKAFDLSDLKYFVKFFSEDLTAAIKPISKILGTVRKAFLDVFPTNVLPTFWNFLVLFKKVVEAFNLSDKDLWNLRNTLGGVFAIFDIGYTIVSKILGVFLDLIGYVFQGSGSFLELTGNVGNFFFNLDKAIKSGDGLNSFFSGLTEILKKPIDFLKNIGTIFSGVFEKLASIDFIGIGNAIKSFFDVSAKAAVGAGNAWDKFVSIVKAVADFFEPLATKLYGIFQNLGTMVQKAMGKFDAQSILGLTGVGALTVVGNMLTRFITTFKMYAKNTIGLGTTLKQTFLTLTKNLQIMQASLQADILMKIATAIGVLALSAALLASVDSQRLAMSVGVMALMLKGLMIAMAQFNAVTGLKGIIKIGVLSDALIALATAIFILSVALKIMSSMSWDEVARGLTALAGSLTIIAGVLRIMPKDIPAKTAGLAGLAISVGLLAISLKIMASLSWEDLGKGLLGMAGALVIIAGALSLMPKDMAAKTTGLIGLSIALNLIALSMKTMSSISWEGIAKGVVGIAAALVIIAGALQIMPKDMVLRSAGLIGVGIALNIIALAVKSMGGMSWEELAKGIFVLAGSLFIIAAATNAMQAALPGAAALLVVSAALAILTPVILALGSMDISQVGMALLALAGTFLVLGVSAAALTPVLPALFALAAVVALIGVGVALAGVGVLAFATGLVALGAAGAVGAAGIVAIVSAFAGLAPMIGLAIGQIIVTMIEVFTNSATTFLNAGVTLILTLLTAIDITAPKIIDTLFNLISKLISKLTENLPKFVDSGMKMINGIMRGIREHIRDTVSIALEIISKFLDGIAKGLPQLSESGANLVITFLNSIANTIRNKSSEIGAAGGNIASALVEGMVKGTLAGVSSIGAAARRLAQKAIDTIKDVLGIHSPSKVLMELGEYAGKGFYYGLLSMQEPVLDAVSQTINDMKDKLASALIDANNQLKDLSDKLKKQQKDKNKSKKDKQAIAQTKKDLAETKATRDAITASQTELNEAIKKNQQNLINLTSNYNSVVAQLSNAQDALKNAQDTLSKAQSDYASQYSELPSFSDSGDLVNNYITALQNQIDSTKSFMEDLGKLRANGLDDTTYKKLLNMGLDAQPFIKALLNSGQSGIDEINKLDKELGSTADTLGSTAAKSLYQAGVNAAQGLVDGLQSQADTIAKQMVSIADEMVKAIKEKLGIASPSKVFYSIGGYATSGLMNGLQKELPKLVSTVSNIGDSAIDAMKDSLRNVSNLVASNTEASMVLKPVLDLSKLESQTGEINRMLNNTRKISIDTSYYGASKISRDTSRLMDISKDTSGNMDTVVTFNQINNSPKALSAAEIYRQTKNGISQIKKAVNS